MWSDPFTTTPKIVQTDFGPWGQDLPGDGEQYCAPTSTVMGLYWLAHNGFTQLAPATYSGQAADRDAATNLERVIAGLLNTSSQGGTTADGLVQGVAAYLSARGIATNQYSVVTSDNPDLAWLATQLAPNFSANPTAITLANFAVGWYAAQSAGSTTFDNFGGHVLLPLSVTPAAPPPPSPSAQGTASLNNPEPATFLAVQNAPENVQQNVTLASVPAGWTLSDLNLPSQSYTQVVSPILGPDSSSDPLYAVLWVGQAWTLSAAARPATQGYAPSPWTLATATSINTNGGKLEVLAPLSGAGELTKLSEGELLLTDASAFTGAMLVKGGVLAAIHPSGGPLFGTGSVTLTNGGALVAPLGYGNPATPFTIAGYSAADGGGSNISIGPGAAMVFNGRGPFDLKITGVTGTSPLNLQRLAAGTLALEVGGGAAALGVTQRVRFPVFPNGTLTITQFRSSHIAAASMPPAPTPQPGLVAPYMIGQQDMALGSGRRGYFLYYDVARGFFSAPVATIDSINVASPNQVYLASADQTITAGGTATVAALEVDGALIKGQAGSMLKVGDVLSPGFAGVILNGGGIAGAALVFGNAEALVYAGAATDQQKVAAIRSTIQGAAGLTKFGAAPLTLTADNSASLSGPISVNSGTLIAASASGSALGVGAVTVNAGATLEACGDVAGAITVANSATLFLNGATAGAGVNVAAIGRSSATRGGALEGFGKIAGPAHIGGIIRAGAATGVLEFAGRAVITEAANFFWRLRRLVDDSNSSLGQDWNGLQFNDSTSVIGGDNGGMTVFLDFSGVGASPDEGDHFWAVGRNWTLVKFPNGDATFYWLYGNFSYGAGNFSLSWPSPGIVLTWTPSPTPQSLAQRRKRTLVERRKLAARWAQQRKAAP
jgi:autotransporter-associated beta strand protein